MKSKFQALLSRAVHNRVSRQIYRNICLKQLRQCGVNVHYGPGETVQSMQIGSVAITPLQIKQYLPSLEKCAALMAAGRFRIIAEQGASRLLLQSESKVVALPPVSTLIDYLGGIIKHWNSLELDETHNVHSIAGVTLEGELARVNYRGVWLEYEVSPKWAEESLEEVFFWSDLLSNYYYRVGPPPRDGIVFDLGSYHGLFGIAAAIDVGPGGRVFCFEPDAKSRSTLEANCRRNDLTNIEVIQAGVSGRTEKRSFVSLGGLGSCLGCQSNATQDVVQVYSLPDCCKIAGIDTPAFVKADIEGAEVEMVESCLEWIKGLPSTVFSIASYHIVDGESTRIRLEQAFRKVKYHVSTTPSGHQTTIAWR